MKTIRPLAAFPILALALLLVAFALAANFWLPRL